MKKFFKNAFGIYKSDIKKLSKNWVAIIIAIGLCILPSLYAWINILASWDPYNNTSGIKVGIVNEDSGASLAGTSFNIGDELINTLRENKKLGWTFYDSREEAIEETRNGNIYAAIIVPENFSQRLCTMIDKEPQKPYLDYYLNEKINAIAPKMTDSGVSTLQKQISNSFIKTVVNKVFEVFNKVGIHLDSNKQDIEKYKNIILLIDGDHPNIQKHLDALLDNAQNGMIKIDKKSKDIEFLKNSLQRTIDFTNGISKNAAGLQANLDEKESEVRSNLRLISTVLSDVSKTTSQLSSDITTNKPNVVTNINNAMTDVSVAQKDLETLSNNVKDPTFSKKVSDTTLNAAQTLKQYNTLLKQLSENLDDLDSVNDMLKNLTKLTNTLASEISSLDSTITQSFDDINKGLELLKDLLKLLNDPISNQKDIREQINTILPILNKNSEVFGLAIQLCNNILTQLDKSAANLSGIQSSLISLIDGIQNRLEIKKISVHTSLSSLQNTMISLSGDIRNINYNLKNTSETVQDTLRLTSKKLDSLTKDLERATIVSKYKVPATQNAVATRISNFTPKLTEINKKLDKLQTNISSKNDAEVLLKDVNELAISAQNSVDSILLNMDNEIVPKLQKYLQIASSPSDLARLLDISMGDCASVQNFLQKITNQDSITTQDIQQLRNDMPSLFDKISKFAKFVRQFDDKVSLTQIITLLSNNAETEGDFFASPVQINTNKFFTVENYGAGLTPFYTTLCLWVGTLLLSALLTTRAKNYKLPFTPNEEFIGKYMFYASFGVIQGFIASMGDIFLLRVQVVHPVLFVILSILYSLVFCMIIFTLVSLFGNVGKAIGIIFLVLQLAGCGGTFPIQVTPPFFQKIYKFLPFTYAISGLREAVAGVVYKQVIIDIVALLLVFVLFMVIGLLLKHYAIKALDRFSKKLGQSGIIEH